MFFSDRGLFSVDLYLADAHDRQGEAPGHPHGGGRPSPEPAVHPVGRKLVARRKAVRVRRDQSGRPVARPVRRGRGADRSRDQAAKLGEILNPSWSPDGRAIAFSAVAGGLTDLYVYDLAADRSAGSPTTPTRTCSLPGRRMAGARLCDRPVHAPASTTWRWGRYSLAVLDLATGAVVQVPGFREAGTSIRSGHPTARASISSPIPTGSPTCTASGWRTAPSRGDESVHRAPAESPRRAPRSRWLSIAGRLIYSVFRANGYELYCHRALP